MKKLTFLMSFLVLTLLSLQAEKKDVYDRLYREYVTLSDYFSSTNPVMRKLLLHQLIPEPSSAV